MMIQFIGYLATFMTGLSFMMKNLRTLRIVNASACLVWIIYGYFTNSVPIIITNAGVFAIHTVAFLKEKYK